MALPEHPSNIPPTVSRLVGFRHCTLPEPRRTQPYGDIQIKIRIGLRDDDLPTQHVRNGSSSLQAPDTVDHNGRILVETIRITEVHDVKSLGPQLLCGNPCHSRLTASIQDLHPNPTLRAFYGVAKLRRSGVGLGQRTPLRNRRPYEGSRDEHNRHYKQTTDALHYSSSPSN